MMKKNTGWQKGLRKFTEKEFNNSFLKQNYKGFSYEDYISNTKIKKGKVLYKYK